MQAARHKHADSHLTVRGRIRARAFPWADLSSHDAPRSKQRINIRIKCVVRPLPDDGSAAVIEVARGVVCVSRDNIQAFIHPDFDHHTVKLLRFNGGWLLAQLSQEMPCL